MMKNILIAFAAGLASAVMFSSIVSGALISLVLLYLSPLPILSALLFLWLWRQTFHLPKPDDRHSLTPFLTLAAIFALGFAGLAWSFYPFVVPDKLTIWQAASATESLAIILAGTVVVLPVIIFYSFYAYRVFGGKATDLTYD